MEISLTGGEEYLIVIGAEDGTGAYELTVQEIER